MKRPLLLLVLIIIMVLAFTACRNVPSEEPILNPTEPVTLTKEQILVLGDVSDDPGEVIEGATPLMTYLADQLSLI